MVDTLRLRVRSIAGEPAHSLLARLAARHDMRASRFAQALGLPLRRAAAGENLSRLARLAAVDESALAAATARKIGTGQSVALGSEVLSWVDWSISPRRVCGACFAQDRAGAGGQLHAAWHRSWWDVQVIRACPFHRRLLQAHCPVCIVKLDWTCLTLDRCQNGHDLADPGVGDVRAALDSYLLGRLQGASANNCFLAELTIGNAARTAERVGAICKHGWSEHFEPEKGDDLRSVGYAASREIERSLPAALDKVVGGAPTGSVGLIASYGWIYRSWLGVPGADHSGGRLLDILQRHAACRGIISVDERSLVADTVPLKIAASSLGKSSETTKKVIAAAGLLPAGSRPGVPFSIGKSELEELCRRLDRLVNLSAAAAILSIGRGQVRSLIQAGLLQYDADASRVGYGNLLRSDRLEDFCRSISARAPSKHRPDGARTIPQACRDASVPIWKVCQAVLRGEIRPLARSSTSSGLADIWIDPEAIGRLAAPRPRPINSVAQALSVHPQAASCLVKAGAFDCMKNPSPGSVELFAARHVKPAELAQLVGVTPRMIVQRLAAANVVPAFGPPDCRQIFYSRTQALERLCVVSDMNEAI